MQQIGGRNIQIFQLILSQNVLFTSVASLIGVLSGILIAITFGKELGNTPGEGLIFKGFTNVDLTFLNLFSYWALGVVSGILATIIIFFKTNLFWTKTKTFKSNKYYSIITGKSGFVFLLVLQFVCDYEAFSGNSIGPYLESSFIINSDNFPSLFLPVVAKKF